MSWAVDHASIPMRDFLFKNRSRLSALIDDIWKWENVKDQRSFWGPDLVQSCGI